MGENDSDNQLVRVEHGSLALTNLSANRILSEIVGTALALARETDLVSARRYKIDDIELCEPDYRQILLWAESLKMEPLTVIERLLDNRTFRGSVELHEPSEGWYPTEFRDGRIETLNWDGQLLPLREFRWVEGLQIRSFNIMLHQPEGIPSVIRLPLPHLTFLRCWGLGWTKIDLSHVPNLTELYCDHIQLGELNLSQVPNLEKLYCEENELTELDLSNVPNLTTLWCYENQLSELDFSNVPRLTELFCSHNQLTELNLSNVPRLTELFCDHNQLTELDLRPALSLQHLSYDEDNTRLIQRPDQEFDQ